MKVKLISHTQNILDVIYTSARTCYNAGSPNDMWEEVENIPEHKKFMLIRQIIESNHYSPLEQVTFTFSIEGISRACSHQLVRHRLCSFSQQSQRYVKFNDVNVVVPETIEKDRQAYAIFEDCIDYIEHAYKSLTDLGIPAEDARAVLPNCAKTNIVMTCNLRELIHICNERLCTRAQKEIRQLAHKMAAQVIYKEDWLGCYLQPKCDRLHYCPEKSGCGRVKSLKEQLCK